MIEKVPCLLGVALLLLERDKKNGNISRKSLYEVVGEDYNSEKKGRQA